MTEQTKAEMLADAIIFCDTRTEVAIDKSAEELRRLSPMEAECTKLLEVNKVLADALEVEQE